MEKIYILSHTDLDGYLSAGLIEYLHKRSSNHGDEISFKHKSWTYGRDLPNTDYIKRNFDTVYVVDVCPNKEFMFDLYETFGSRLIWIDHHIDKDNELYEEFINVFPDCTLTKIFAEREHETSALMLVYKYFVSCTNEDIPDWIKYISDFDCWNRTNEDYWQNMVMPYMIYMKKQVFNPVTAVQYINEHSISYNAIIPTEDAINCGRFMYEELLSIYKAEAIHGFERILDVETNGVQTTIKAWICNTQNRSSVIFEQMKDKDDYDVFIPYNYNGKLYMYSMYTWKSDISCDGTSICSVDGKILTDKLSFAGHPDAAGARSELFIF